MTILKTLIKLKNCENEYLYIYLGNAELSFVLEICNCKNFVCLVMLFSCFLSDVVVGDMLDLNSALAYCCSSKTKIANTGKFVAFNFWKSIY